MSVRTAIDLTGYPVKLRTMKCWRVRTQLRCEVIQVQHLSVNVPRHVLSCQVRKSLEQAAPFYSNTLVFHKLTNCTRHGRLGYCTIRRAVFKMVHGDRNFGDQIHAVTTMTAMIGSYPFLETNNSCSNIKMIYYRFHNRPSIPGQCQWHFLSKLRSDTSARLVLSPKGSQRYVSSKVEFTIHPNAV
jgi:hypothetical protein